MSVPICHKTLTHTGFLTKDMPPGSPCLGSRCAMWVEEQQEEGARYPRIRGDGTMWTDLPTGKGVCADNRWGVPFPDPAKEK